MDLKITGIHNEGTQNEEYVDLIVLEDCNLKNYQLADTTYTGENKVSNKLRHVYWFGAKAVKAGQRVRVFTGSGKAETVTLSGGAIMHKFYWGLNEAVWNNDGDAAMLMKLATWNTFKVA